MKKIFLLITTLLLITAVLSAESDPERSSILAYYDANLFSVHYTMFGGPQLNFQNSTESFNFGISRSMERALNEYSESKYHLERYKSQNLSANVLLYGGILAALVGAFYPLMAIDANSTYEDLFLNNRIALGLIGGGYISVLAGTLMQPASYENLTRAVNIYNRRKLGEY